VTDVVLDLISAGAVSKALSAAGFAKDEKIGRQSRPFEPLLRTGGFRTSQDQRWQVEVWHRGDDRDDAYERMTEALSRRGYQVERRVQPGRDELLVTRRRPPTAEEWMALDLLAGRPLMLDSQRLRTTFEAGTEAITADVLTALHRSGLVGISASFPLMRDPDSGTHPEYGSVVSLTTEGLKLLIRRNQARQARGVWALIAPEHRGGDRPPLLAGDLDRDTTPWRHE
jgi:hypothetical protein